MTVREIVQAYLKEHGYDGLYHAGGECGCELDKLMPECDGCEVAACRPGYKTDGCHCGEGCDFHIQERKAE